MTEPMGLDEKALTVAAFEYDATAPYSDPPCRPYALSCAIQAYLRTAGLVPVPVIGEE